MLLLEPPLAQAVAPPTRLAAPIGSFHRIRALAAHNLTIRLRDPGQAITYFALPMILMIVLQPLYVRAVPGGVTVIVTGLIVMFSVFVVSIAGNSILAERQWKTWDRLRQSRANPAEIVIGKTFPVYVLMLIQQSVLVVYGCAVVGAPWPASFTLIAVSIVVWAFVLLAMGTAIAVLARSLSELSAISDIGAMVLSSLAGALVPLSIMPGWVQVAAHVSPGYYALEMLQGAFAGEAGTVFANAGILLAIGLALFGFATYRLARGWGRTTLL